MVYNSKKKLKKAMGLNTQTQHVYTAETFQFFQRSETVGSIALHSVAAPRLATQHPSSSVQQGHRFWTHVYLQGVHQKLELICQSIRLADL
mmetsp:Transcript_21445/g.48322  ORF Transcript_21445/g.48322 Transcript_21445/m.48322 type:complete len:91 (-) Transcript_21445:1620-1892(-)